MKTSQAARFVVVGTGGYLINLAVFALLDAVGVRYVAASIGSYFVANAFIYLGNRYFTFGLGRHDFWIAYLRCLLAGGVIASLNSLTLTLLVERAGLIPMLGLAVSLLIVTPLAFFLNKRWAFRLPAPSSSNSGECEDRGGLIRFVRSEHR